MLLQLKDVNKSFSDKHVLKSINLTATSGRALGLLGRNGAGKTTSIRIIMDVFGADSGQVLIDNLKPNYQNLRIGYLPEERGLYPKRKIIEQLVYFAMLKGMSKKEATTSCDYWLERLEMKEYRNKKLETLSKGNQQKIQLITAVASNPDIVILDEPFSGLDPVNSLLLKDVVKQLISDNKIVIFSSHQMSYIEEFCDDIAIISNGEIVLSGDLKSIIRSYPRDKIVVSSKDNEKIAHNLTYEYEFAKENLIIKISNEKDKQTVMSYLTSNYDIDVIKVYEPSLNDIFVEYTLDKKEGA